jgi:molybdate transport system substrate-binding protein
MLVRFSLALIAVAATVLTAGCGGGTPGGGTPGPGVRGTVTVFAASSLSDAFREAADAFTLANPDAQVSFNFGGSPTLVTQLDQGARADVLATADEANMQSARDKRLIDGSPATFARNRLAIIVPKANPAHIETPAALAKPGLKLVLAQKSVPVGAYARQALAKFDGKESYPADFDARVLTNVVSEESSVKSVVTKVQLGEADAGIVYVTDVTPGVIGDITLIAIADAYNVVASYPIAITKDASHRAAAQAFVDFVLSSAGQAILTKHGFMPAR